MSLAPTDEQGGLNPRRVAGIVRDWVNGKTLPEIVDAWCPTPAAGDPLARAGRYLFRDLAGQIPWGLGALQLVGLPSEDTPEITAAKRVPAMAFYGVSEPSALAMRMVGVPRAAALGLGQRAPEFGSFRAARDWVASQSDDEWTAAGRGRGFDGRDLRIIWSRIGGTAA
jgi:hypothetical protein